MFNPVTKPKISSEFSPLIQLHNCDIYFQMNRHACFIKGVIKFSYQGLNVLFISTDNSIIKQTNIPCSCARSCLFYQKISEYRVNTRPRWPWGPCRGLYRRAASLLGWKSSLLQLFLVKSFQNIFLERFIWTKNNLIGEKKFYKNLQE